MNVKLKVLRKVLEEAITNIDAGNSNHSDDELDDIISSLTKLNRGIKRISKREACERILRCSPSSFDNYIKLGLIPRGHKDIINSYKEANVSSTELYNGIMSLHNVFDYVEKQDNKTFWKSMRKLHESIKGAHFDEEYAKWQVSTMHHTADNGKVCKGEIYNYDCAKNVFDKYVRNINSSITVWDVYVAINAQYHDYVRLYSEWFRNINKNELDNKIIESAITFYFKDEDSGSTKTWNYFKTAN
jgi:hypothetical protein